MFYNVKEGKLTLGGMDFDYITFGSGGKPLVMIQGLNTRGIKGAGFSLAYMYRIFDGDFRVYLFDRRPVVEDGFTVREMAGDVAMAMDALGISGAAVFGVSQGGMIAQYLAIDRPDLVEKLVLAVTLSRNNETVIRVVESWIRMARQGEMARLVADMAEKMYSEAYLKRYRPFLPLLTVLQKPKDVERFAILAKSCLTCDTYELLDRIQCPVLVLGGAKDQVVTGEASREIAQKRNCRLHLYENLGHAAYEEARDFNGRVYGFLQSCGTEEKCHARMV